MMTREQLIEKSLQAMRQAPGLLAASEPEDQSTDEYDAIVIATINERVPDCEFKICGDLALEVECCESCHTFYPHYDMYLETLPNGEPAWICCSVRSALLNPNTDATNPERELMDLEKALGGN